MASIITATTTSGLTQSADNSGVLQLASGTGNLVTVPSVTGTAMVSGNMPAFSAYRSTTQSISNNTWTKIQFQTEDFDTNNNYDNSTNYRFTPTIAGYYQISVSACFASASNFIVSIYKNGSEFATSATIGISGILDSTGSVSKLIYFNGTSDYVEGYCYQNSGGALNIQARQYASWFTGSMIRSA